MRRGPIGSVVDAFVPATLHAAIVAASEEELVIVSRRDWITTGNAPVRSEARHVVRRSSITGAASAPHARYAGVETVTVAAGAATVRIDVPEGSDAGRALLASGPASA